MKKNTIVQFVCFATDLELDAAAYASQLERYADALRQLGCDVSDASIVDVRTRHLP